MQRKDFTILFILVVAFLLMRLLFLSSNIHLLYSHNEAFRAKLATDVLILQKGWHIFDNIFEYQYSPFHGGSLIVSILYLPFAYVLGINKI